MNRLKIKEATSALDLCEIIKLHYQHTNIEYDCDWETYAYHIINFFYTDNYYMWLAVDDGFPVGYLIVYKDMGLVHEIGVVDIFVLPEWQRKGVGLQLVQKFIPWAVSQKDVKRVKWNSTKLPETKYWAKFSPIKIHEEKVFYSTIEDYDGGEQ